MRWIHAISSGIYIIETLFCVSAALVEHKELRSPSLPGIYFVVRQRLLITRSFTTFSIYCANVYILPLLTLDIHLFFLRLLQSCTRLTVLLTFQAVSASPFRDLGRHLHVYARLR